jgi:hypothetical protein
VPQVALLLSTAANYRKMNGLFSRDYSRLSGVLQALLESQQSVEIVGEHHLAGRMAEYPLIVVPEWAYLEPKFKKQLVAYVKGGGNLLLIGPKSAALFQEELDVNLDGEAKGGARFLAHRDSFTPINGEAQTVKLGAKARAFGSLQFTNTVGVPAQPAASIATLGKGRIAATYVSLGQDYARTRDAGIRQFLGDLARELFPQPMVEVKGSSTVDVSVARNHGNLLVNLVNTSGPHQTEPILESIPPVGPLDVAVRLATKPAKITLQPAGTPLAFDFRDGVARVTVPRVDIHEAVVIEER